jgi:hypothetical protein
MARKRSYSSRYSIQQLIPGCPRVLNSSINIYSMPPAVKMTHLIKKLPSITTEEFHRYWSEDHPKAVFSLPSSKKLLKYQQHHCSATGSEIGSRAGPAISGFDGAAFAISVITFLLFRQPLLPYGTDRISFSPVKRDA